MAKKMTSFQISVTIASWFFLDFIVVCWKFKFLKLYIPKIDTILMKSAVLKNYKI
jgi:hypothetical protein